MAAVRPVTPPIGSIVRDRVMVGDALYRVIGDFGPIGFDGEHYAEIEPFPNRFDDPSSMVPAAVLEIASDLEVAARAER